MADSGLHDMTDAALHDQLEKIVRDAFARAYTPHRGKHFHHFNIDLDFEGVVECGVVVRQHCARNNSRGAVDIQHVFVCEEFRRRGLMTAIVLGIQTWCRAEGFYSIYMLRGMVENEETFQKFWRGLHAINPSVTLSTFGIVGYIVQTGEVLELEKQRAVEGHPETAEVLELEKQRAVEGHPETAEVLELEKQRAVDGRLTQRAMDGSF
jgi:GNAT superfamily N-acetyltransferase